MKDHKSQATCKDCNLPYVNFGLDCTLPNNQWELINGSPDGLLCANCIARRASKIKSAVAIRMVIEIIPHV